MMESEIGFIMKSHPIWSNKNAKQSQFKVEEFFIGNKLKRNTQKLHAN